MENNNNKYITEYENKIIYLNNKLQSKESKKVIILHKKELLEKEICIFKSNNEKNENKFKEIENHKNIKISNLKEEILKLKDKIKNMKSE